MKGRNVLNLCEAEMIVAVEYYLNNVLFKQESSVQVESVKENHNFNPTFEVMLVEIKKEE